MGLDESENVGREKISAHSRNRKATSEPWSDIIVIKSLQLKIRPLLLNCFSLLDVTLGVMVVLTVTAVRKSNSFFNGPLL
jgi:flagellar biosynthesis component FlhA